MVEDPDGKAAVEYEFVWKLVSPLKCIASTKFPTKFPIGPAEAAAGLKEKWNWKLARVARANYAAEAYGSRKSESSSAASAAPGAVHSAATDHSACGRDDAAARAAQSRSRVEDCCVGPQHSAGGKSLLSIAPGHHECVVGIIDHDGRTLAGDGD